MSVRAQVYAPMGDVTVDVEVEVAGGGCTAVMGPNGAGKTTLIHVLAGLIPVQRGRVVLADQVVEDSDLGIRLPPERRPIALHSQHNLLFPHLSVVDNVAFGLRCAGLATGPARTRAAEWLDKVGLAHLAAERPDRLSGGQAQRVGLVRAAACRPDVLLLDESLAALDAESRTHVRKLLADLDGTRLLVTHDPVEARVLADQLVIMQHGRVTQTGAPAAVAADPRTPWTAGLMDVNLLTGHSSGTDVALDCGLTLITATSLTGPVLVTFSPAAITLSASEPHTSARNTWEAEVTRVQPESDRVRVFLGAPAPAHAWVTPQAAAELGLAAGARCWAALKATELTVRPA
ncbi:sulfate/molybdate ABC transporter ATP-binding protein [Candidatus Poriferisocius sp.]|uniref:sulfate/molybdate ABC transporter ATP-binding protein n=1 Tax=Candidatus Poriferisocius sp. TaxID=3101276 RepID=UPI003B5B8198